MVLLIHGFYLLEKLQYTQVKKGICDSHLEKYENSETVMLSLLFYIICFTNVLNIKTQAK